MEISCWWKNPKMKPFREKIMLFFASPMVSKNCFQPHIDHTKKHEETLMLFFTLLNLATTTTGGWLANNFYSICTSTFRLGWKFFSNGTKSFLNVCTSFCWSFIKQYSLLVCIIPGFLRKERKTFTCKKRKKLRISFSKENSLDLLM